MKARIVLTLIAGFVLTGCGGSAAGTATGKTHVIAAFYPLAFAAAEIGGDTVEVRNVTPPGVEPHDLELSGRELETIGDAALVLYLRGFQPALDDAIASVSGAGVDLLDSVATRPGDDKIGVDPHVWLDPVRFAQIAAQIGVELGRSADAAPLQARLRELDAEFQRGLSRCARDEIVTSHAAFGYLAERYGLKEVAITGISPEAEPTPRDLEAVVRQVRETGATTIFFETLISPRLARTVAREVGAETAALNPLEGLTDDEVAAGEDYVSVMRENLAALREALGCR